MRNLLARLHWIIAAKSTAAAVVHTLGSRIAILALNFGTSIIVARYLGPAGRGAGAAMSLWPIIFCGLTTLGIPTALRYHVRRRPSEAEDLFSVAVILGLITGIVACVLGDMSMPLLLRQYPTSVIHFAQVMMLFAPQMMLNGTLQAYLESRSDYLRANFMQCVPPATTLGMLLILHAEHSLTPYSVPLAYFVPSIVMTLWVALKLRQSFRLPTMPLTKGYSLLRYGLRAYGLNVLATMSTQVDQAIIIGFMSAASFGLYGVALNMSSVLGIFAGSLNTVLFPKASELEPELAIKTVARSARLVFAATTAAYVMSLMVLPFMIHAIYGRAYSEDVGLTRILMLEVVMASTASTLAQAFMATNRPGLVTLLQGIGLAISFPLMLITIPRYGLLGAAYALLIATAVRLICLLLAFPLILKLRIPTLILTYAELMEIRKRIVRSGAHSGCE